MAGRVVRITVQANLPKKNLEDIGRRLLGDGWAQNVGEPDMMAGTVSGDWVGITTRGRSMLVGAMDRIITDFKARKVTVEIQ